MDSHLEMDYEDRNGSSVELDDLVDRMAELDDSDEMGDPQDDGARDPDGYCKHGVYVGGCGIDFMCGACECGD